MSKLKVGALRRETLQDRPLNIVGEDDPLTRELALFARKLSDNRRAKEREVLTPEEWIDTPYYSGNLGVYDPISRVGLWPATRATFIEACKPQWKEVVATGAIGTGKTELAVLLVCRWLYELSCYVSPQALMGLQEHSTIAFVLTHMNKKKAEQKLYTPIRNAVRSIPYFKDNYPPNPRLESKLEFPKGIIVRCGITDPESVRSEDLAVTVVDEINFLDVVAKSRRDKEGRVFDAAKEIYQTARRRQDSRFAGTSLWTPRIVMLSSRDRPDDFLERMEREVRESSKTTVSGIPGNETLRGIHAVVFSKSIWHAKPKGSFGDECFTVEVGGDARRSKILFDGEEPTPEAETLNVPVEFRDAFEKNVDEALREFAGLAVAGVGRLFPDPAIIDACVTAASHPFTRMSTTLTDGGDLLLEDIFDSGEATCCPKRWRFGHIDPALTGDSLGLALVHVHGRKMVSRPDPNNAGKFVKRGAPVYRVDLALQVTPPKNGEIRLASVEHLLYTLQEQGMRMGGVTIDGFQSASIRQNMEEHGIPCDKFSVDRHADAYLELRDVVEEERIELYHYPPLLVELEQLIYYRHIGKVDHPPDGSKDVADALAGAVSGAMKQAPLASTDWDGMRIKAEIIGAF